MRIQVNLGLFFHDHRSLAKIFINKKMKSIRDVEQHISDIFAIQDFYLKCDNQYLPPCEDVRILNYDDLVWAVPQNKQDEISKYDDPCGILKRKKKKKKIVIDNDITENVAVGQHEPKKRKHLENIDIIDDTEHKTDNPKKKKKSKKSDKVTDTPVEVSNHLKDSGRDSLDNISEGSPNMNNNVDVKSLVSSFEKKKLSFADKFENVIRNESERKINIIKTIIISPNNTNIKESQIGTCNGMIEPTTSTDCIQVDGEQTQTQELNSTSVQEDEMINDDERRSISSSAMDTISSMCCSVDNELDVNVNKRKRKRTRTRRKRSTLNKTEFNTSFEQPVYNFVHKQFVVQTPKHLRFTEGDFEQKKDETVPTTNDLNTAIDKPTNSSNDVIEINESIVNGNDSVKSNNVINLDSSYSSKHIEECIAKQPMTENTEPKVGDVIAFKILRISECYTPEVSTTIIGKVMQYSPEKKEITFDIVYGYDQCSFPQGKFSLETDEQPTEENCKFSCLWNTLLEPRFVFL